VPERKADLVSARNVTLAGLALVCALGAAGTALCTGPASAAFAGANGKLAFFSTRGSAPGSPSADIYLIRTDGSAETNVTPTSALEVDPAWSPDGSRIAFVRQSGSGADRDLYLMYPDGSGVTRVATLSDFNGRLGWSPDGRKLVYGSLVGISAINVDGSGMTVLTNDTGPNSWPAWSPDGRRIAYTAFADGARQIFVMNADGSGRTRLTLEGGAWPSWSPDGTKIAFNRLTDDGHVHLYAMNADGSGETQLTSSSAFDVEPAWSPDGTRIAFASSPDLNADDSDIYVVNADGSGRTQLTRTPGDDESPDWQPLPDNDGNGVPDAWDPDIVAAAVSALPRSDFANGAPGHLTAILSRLDHVESLIAAGETADAVSALDDLRLRLDGCGTTADRDDWIVDCAAQLQIRALIDQLIGNLRS
jgi:TolB protein